MDTSPIDLRFSYVPGIFEHDLQPTGPADGFRAKTLPRFGIIDRVYDQATDQGKGQWERLSDHLKRRNAANPTSERFKVLFIARHGEAVNNLKERQVGRTEWQQHWSKLDGDGHLTWSDAALTETGIRQAETAGDLWRRAIAKDGVCAPTSFYTSPLTRCLQTTQVTWESVPLPPSTNKQPKVKEALRELFGIHTCDRRSSAAQIRARFPAAIVGSEISDADELWTPDRRETLEEHAELWRGFLRRLFEEDGAEFVSLTTHSGAVRALYLAIGHPDVWVANGATVAVMVRAVREGG